MKEIQEWISKCKLKTPDLRLIGNRMSDDLFYVLTHTPLHIQWIEKSGYKIIVCMSGHNFVVKGKHLTVSGLVARDDKDGLNNIQAILDNNPEAIALVSQIAKRYFDKETVLQNYKSRIFCLLQRKQGITNKISSHIWKIKQVYINR